DNAIVLIDMHHVWFIGASFGVFHLCVGNENDQVSGIDEVGCCAINTDDAGATLTSDGVGLKPGTIDDIHDRHHLTGQDIRSIEEILVDSYRAHVVQVGFGHGCPMDLGVEHGTQHRFCLSASMKTSCWHGSQKYTSTRYISMSNMSPLFPRETFPL